MKVIKKITAIMLSIMMVLGMCSVVGAAEGTTLKGKITINEAISGQTYTIYKMLDLSYDPVNKLYSYKPASDAWKTFFENGEPGNDYATINENGYITWKDKSVAGEDEEEKKVRLEKEAAALAQKALVYAKDTNNSITKTKDEQAKGTTVIFSDLDLGYYLVDSSLGALCGLTTTDNEVTIKEKNGVPTVDKNVYEGNNLQKDNYADIGDTVTFETTVEVKKGASNYKLYDKMSTGFQLKENSAPLSTLTVIAYNTEGEMLDQLTQGQDYIFEKTSDGFTVEFKNTYLKKHENVDYKIKVGYNAILTGNATIGKDNGNKNTAYLTYGDNNTKSEDSVTNTFTFEIPVFKYTGTDTALAGAKFSLYSKETCDNANRINLIKVGETETYRRFITGDADASKVTEITTTKTGKFSITGLKPGTYYLKEIAAPKGYNLLAAPTTVEVTSEGIIKVKNGEVMKETSVVNVENKSGSILPSTGGIGTTIFYIAGAFLVLISGVVLIAKKRTDSK